MDFIGWLCCWLISPSLKSQGSQVFLVCRLSAEEILSDSIERAVRPLKLDKNHAIDFWRFFKARKHKLISRLQMEAAYWFGP
jgi:hypothetical protein